MAQLQYNILDIIIQDTGAKPRKQGNRILLDPCPLCNHKGHFYIYPKTNSYYSFSGCCHGGTIVDWLMEYRGLSLAQAIASVYGKAKPINKQRRQENRELAKLLTEKVESFFKSCIQKYKLFQYAEDECKANGIDYTNPFYRWIRQGVRFYDRVTDEFINGDFEKRVQLMQNHKDEYFYKLQPGVMTDDG